VARLYGTEAAAFRRVDALRKMGIWPGVVTLPTGQHRLTFDPDWPDAWVQAPAATAAAGEQEDRYEDP
jgi:hypothetical protein